LTFEDQRQARDQEKDVGSNPGDALVHFSQQVAEASTQGIGGHDATAYLVRNQHDGAGRRLQGKAQTIDRALD
jgi:hypothetical protein